MRSWPRLDLVEGVKKLAVLHTRESAGGPSVVVPLPASSSTELAQSGGESMSGRRARVDEVRGFVGAGRGNRSTPSSRDTRF